METEPEKITEETPAPPPDQRRSWWCRIYVGACLVLATLGAIYYMENPVEILGTALVRAIFSALLLPVGLAFDLGGNVDKVAEGSTGLVRSLLIFVEIGTVPLAYYTYYIHWQLTKNAVTRRTFLLLMLSLVLFVSASLVGCERITDRPLGLQ
jgi:hypothetical protein